LGVTVIIVSLFLYNNQPWSLSILTDLLTTFVFMLFTAILVAGLLPVFETVFNVLTNITLMEYMDPNNKLLRRLMIEAPGTYQHSMLVGNLAEAAASSIKANGLFCRVSTLYHDIGKLTNPYYFTENQQGGVNMHQLLTPLESAQVIIGHVRDGVALARKEGLPEQFIDIIKEHHGTTLAQCMYYDQCNLMGGDKSLVDERDFRYGGPKPRSKESAIIMISDVLEAASRTLGEFTDENLTELVETLVQGKAEDGQFDDCSLTFEELGIVKRALVKTLLMAGHSRIKYPYQEQQEQPPQAGEG
jgi:putative nucleotidyltransferase with HDIG domain